MRLTMRMAQAAGWGGSSVYLPEVILIEKIQHPAEHRVAHREEARIHSADVFNGLVIFADLAVRGPIELRPIPVVRI